MNEEIRWVYGLLGLIIASSLLTWLTKPYYYESVLPKRQKKHKSKRRLRDAQPYRRRVCRLTHEPGPTA